MKLNLYDVAAGALIAREAGAVVTDFNRPENYPDDGIVCTGPGVYEEMMEIIEHPQMEYCK